MAIQRQTGKKANRQSGWQARSMAEGVDGLLDDATRPADKPPLSAAPIGRVVEMTLAEPPGEATHWTRRAMARLPGSAIAACSGSGRTVCSRTGSRPSSCRPARSSPPSCHDVVGLYIDLPEHCASAVS